MPDPSKPNDYEKLMQPVEEGPAFPDGLPDVDVHHAEGCGRHRGGACDCDPEIKLRPSAPAPSREIVDVAFFREQSLLCPELCYVTSLAVGFLVSIYRIAGVAIGEAGTWYQVMRWDELPGPGQEFWDGYLLHKPQFFPSPERAAAVFVEERRKWLAQHHN